jgi:hypothetical protein
MGMGMGMGVGFIPAIHSLVSLLRFITSPFEFASLAFLSLLGLVEECLRDLFCPTRCDRRATEISRCILYLEEDRSKGPGPRS